MPRDFRITLSANASTQPDQFQAEFQKQLLTVVEQVKQFVTQNDQAIVQKIMELLKPVTEASRLALQTGQQNKASIDQIMELLSRLPQTPAPAPLPLSNENISSAIPVVRGTEPAQAMAPVA